MLALREDIYSFVVTGTRAAAASSTLPHTFALTPAPSSRGPPDEPPTAYRVRGPSAIGGDPRRFWNLARTLAATDWKVRFYGSALGYVWSLLRPLLLFGIVYFVFSVVVKAGRRDRLLRRDPPARDDPLLLLRGGHRGRA